MERWTPASRTRIAVRVAIPVFLGGLLVVLTLFSCLDWIGRKATSYRPIGIEELAEDAARKKDESSKTKKKDNDEDKPSAHPRKVAVLLALNLLASCYLVDALAVVLASMWRKLPVPFLDFSLSLASLAIYSIVAIFLIAEKRPEATLYAKYTIVAGVTLVLAPLALACSLVCWTQESSVGALGRLSLVTTSLRVTFAVALVSAYHPNFRYTPSKSEETAIDERTPLLSTSGTQLVASSKAEGAEVEEEGDDTEDEEKPKIRKYDLLAVAQRIRRLLPYVAPLRTPLIRGLVVACILLSLAGNVSKVLLPRQLGKRVTSLSEGNPPWSE